MKDITHEILSEIHHLLSIATEEQLRCAGNLPNTSPHLRTALTALAAEKSSTAMRGGFSTADAPATRKSKTGDEARRNARSAASGLPRELAKALENLSKSDIQAICTSVGLPLTVRNKDARGRIIRRFAGIVADLPEEKKRLVLSALRIKADNQTEGWVGVIRKGQ